MNGIKHDAKNKVQYLWKLVQEYELLLLSQLFVFAKKAWGCNKHERNKLVSSLKKQVRIFTEEVDGDKYVKHKYTKTLSAGNHSRLHCFWILLDYIERVDSHYATGTYSQISMVIDGKDYDVIYVELGEEKLCLSHIENNGETSYIVVLENLSQIPYLRNEKIRAFATVTLFGKITYYSEN